MPERTLLSYTAPPNPAVVDSYSGIEVIRREQESTGQLLVTIGTEHKAVKGHPEANGIRKEFAFVMSSPRSQIIPVKVYTESRDIPVRHKGVLFSGVKYPEINTRNLNAAMRWHKDMGLTSGLAVINNCERSSVLNPTDERNIILQLSDQFSRQSIMRYLITRQIPLWYDMNPKRRKKPNLGDYLDQDISSYYGELLAKDWHDFDFSLEHSIGVSREVFNDFADIEGHARSQYALKRSVGHLWGMTEPGEVLFDTEAVSEAYHKIKDSFSLDKITKGWGEETTPNVIYVVGKPHVRAMAGEFAKLGRRIDRT